MVTPVAAPGEEAAVQVGQHRRASPFVQIVDVLGDDPQVGVWAPAPGSESVMASVRRGGGHEVDPPEEPRVDVWLVAAPGLGRGQVLRVDQTPQAGLSVPEGRHTRVGGHPGSGEHGDPVRQARKAQDAIRDGGDGTERLAPDRVNPWVGHQAMMTPSQARPSLGGKGACAISENSPKWHTT